MKLTIAWLYPNLMGTYGDRGNIIALVKRCQWRGIEVEVKEMGLAEDNESLISSNLIFMGGAQDRQQRIVSDDIFRNKGPLILDLVNRGIPALFVCASYQFMGHFYRSADGVDIPGLGLFDLHTVNPGRRVSRCIGNIVIELSPDLFGRAAAKPVRTTLVGFENHGGRTYLGQTKPLGRVIKGYGNNGDDRTEGAIYKNAIGCYFHGPLLPRNPQLADLLISRALGVDLRELKKLPDFLEEKAHREALSRD